MEPWASVPTMLRRHSLRRQKVMERGRVDFGDEVGLETDRGGYTSGVCSQVLEYRRRPTGPSRSGTEILIEGE